MTNKLTKRQAKFCKLYVSGGNVTEAAVAAGYSFKYADRNGKKLVNIPQVSEELRRRQNRLMETADKSATDVVNEFSIAAFSDHVDFLKEDELHPGRWIYKSPGELSVDQRKVVEVTYIRQRTHKVDGEKIEREEYRYKLADKMTALNQMGRHFGIFDDKLRISTTTNPFKNVSSDKLLQLKQSFTSIMSDQTLAIEGEIVEQKPN